MLQNTDVFTDSLNKELKPHGTDAFPLAGYEEVYNQNGGYFLPWHWHEEMEVVYILEGSLSFQIGSFVCTLKDGDFLFINSNVLHSAKGNPHAVLHSFVFSPLLLMGNKNSAFDTEYITPLLKSRLSHYIFRDKEYAKEFSYAFEALRNDSFGYEFIIRNALSTALLKIIGENKDVVYSNDMKKKEDDKVGLMLSYIYENYSHDITLRDLSRVCSLSEREVLRQFRKTTGESPIQYTIKYKLLRSINEMSVSPDKALSRIALECGFPSPAYYTKKFKEIYGQSPRAYRERVLKERDKRLFIT